MKNGLFSCFFRKVAFFSEIWVSGYLASGRSIGWTAGDSVCYMILMVDMYDFNAIDLLKIIFGKIYPLEMLFRSHGLVMVLNFIMI